MMNRAERACYFQEQSALLYWRARCAVTDAERYRRLELLGELYDSLGLAMRLQQRAAIYAATARDLLLLLEWEARHG